MQMVDSSGYAQVLRNNNLAGTIKLDSFNVSLKWSTIGNLHLHLIQVTTFEDILNPIIFCLRIFS